MFNFFFVGVVVVVIDFVFVLSVCVCVCVLLLLLLFFSILPETKRLCNEGVYKKRKTSEKRFKKPKLPKVMLCPIRQTYIKLFLLI